MASCCSLRCGALTSGFLHAITTGLLLVLTIIGTFSPSPDIQRSKRYPNMDPEVLQVVKAEKTAMRTAMIITEIMILAMAVMTIIGAAKGKKMYLIPFMSFQFTLLISSIPAFVYAVMSAVAAKIPSEWLCLLILVHFIATAIECLLLTVTYRYYRQPGREDTLYPIDEYQGQI